MQSDAAVMGSAPVFPYEDSLPGAQGESPSLHRNTQARRRESGLDMGWHVVGAFRGVGEMDIELGYQPIEPGLEVVTSRRIGVLLDRQAGGSMTDEDCAESFLDTSGAN